MTVIKVQAKFLVDHFRSCGYSYKRIARETNISVNTIKQYERRVERQKNMPPKPKVIRRVIRGHTGTLITRHLRSNPFATLKQIREKCKLSASLSSISRYLIFVNWGRRQAKKKPLLRDINVQKRLAFCRQMVQIQMIICVESCGLMNSPFKRIPTGKSSVQG